MATLLGIVQNTAGFLVARFFLGATESGLFPGVCSRTVLLPCELRLFADSASEPKVVFYFSMWYKRRERQYRISLFFSAASLAGAFGGILAYVSEVHTPCRAKRNN